MVQLSADQIALLYELSHNFYSCACVDTAELVSRVVRETKRVLDAEGCSVLLLDPATDELFFPYVSPEQEAVAATLRGLRMPRSQGIAGAVLESGEPRLVEDTAQEPSFYPGIDASIGGHTRSVMCAPLRTRQGVIGVIELINKRSGKFSRTDLAFLEAIAGNVAVALENARLLEAAREAERQLRDRVATLERERPRTSRFAELVASSPRMEQVLHLLEAAIASPVTVLLLGETGTGKEVLARTIHFHGPRRDRPFLAVNCAALNESLLESELFGYRKGAFTGAHADRRGLFEAADGGTLFLDEVGDMPLALQVKLLRVLETGEVLPVGASETRRVDVRLISATHKDLEAEVQAGRFRSDLYYRLAVFPIVVPPLRERMEDLPALAHFLLQRIAKRWQRNLPTLTREALELLHSYEWPGNIRELEHELERACALAAEGETLAPAHFSERLQQQGQAEPLQDLRRARRAFERRYIERVLAAHSGNVSAAARTLGLSRVMLQRKMKTFGLRGNGRAAADR